MEAPDADPFEYAAGARRFEVGSANPAAHVALREAVDAIDAVGVDEIQDRIREHVERLIGSVPAGRLLTPATPESGLVTVDVDDPEATVDRLTAEGIVTRSLSEPEAVRRRSTRSTQYGTLIGLPRRSSPSGIDPAERPSTGMDYQRPLIGCSPPQSFP